MEEQTLIKYFRALGLTVNRSTKARGHQGFYLKNRIDVSRNTPPDRVVPTLLHEFAHYIHSQIEPDMPRTGGTFTALFGEENKIFTEELIKVTNFVDENSLFLKLYEHKDRLKNKIKDLERIIKKDYPAFLRSKKFKEFEKYIKKSKARYLLKYDRVKLIERGFFKKTTTIYTIDRLEEDFPDMPAAFAAYIRLRSAQRRQGRVSAKISRYKKYYEKPAELFARLVEGIYIDREWTEALAPYTCEKFYENLKHGSYRELSDVINA